MISKTVKSLILKSSIIVLFAGLLASCSMLEREEGARVSYKLDSKTIEKIRETAESESYSRRGRGVDTDSSTFSMEVSVHGDYNKTLTSTISTETEVAFDGIPVGSNIYVEASIYTQTDGERVNLYKGKSKTFTVRSGENQVVFVLRRVTGDEESGGSGGESGSGGTNGPVVTNELPVNVIFVANNGDSGNDGTEENPLDSIEHAVGKIKAIVEDANSGHAADEEWGIVLLTNLSGAQKVTTEADGYMSKLVIASKEVTDIKTIDGGFTTAPAYHLADEEDNSTLTILSSSIIILQCIKITGGWSTYGGGIKQRAGTLYIKPGTEIFGNKAVYCGAGIHVATAELAASDPVRLIIAGGVIGGEGAKANIATGRDSDGSFGEGGGIYISGAKYSSLNAYAYLTIESGSIIGNTGNAGGGIYAEGNTEIEIKNGVISDNTASGTIAQGGGIYLSNESSSNISLDMQGGSIRSNTAGIGGGICAYNTQILLSGGSITSNTSTTGKGAGINYSYSSNNLGMKGDITFGSNDYISLYGSAIGIKGTLNGTGPVATIQPNTYNLNDVIIEDACSPAMSSTDFAAACAKFKVLPQTQDDSGNTLASPQYWIIDGYGTLQKDILRLSVSPSGTGNGSDLSVPFGSIDSAINYLTGLESSGTDLSHKDIIISIEGDLGAKQTISGTLHAKSLTIVGELNGDSFQPKFMIKDEGLDITLEGTTVILNCLIINHCNNAIIVGDDSNKRTNVVLDDKVIIRDNNADKWTKAPVYIHGGASVTMKDGALMDTNTNVNWQQYGECADAVFVDNGATFDMQGGIISSNANSKNGSIGIGVCVATGGSFSMGGGAALYKDGEPYSNNIYLCPGTKINITKNLTASRQCLIMLDDTNTSLGDYILEPATGVNIASASQLFSLMCYSGRTLYIGTDGKLTDVNPKTINYYIAQDGTGDGSESSPLGSISAAVALMTQSDTDYVLNISGELTGEQVITEYIHANAIIIKGTDSTAKLNGNGNDVTLTVKTSERSDCPAPTVIIKNITITGAAQTGLVVGNKTSTYNSKVELGDGAKITGNGSETNTADGAGVYVAYNNTFTLREGCEISGNKTTGMGGGIYCDCESSPGYVHFYGGLIKNNTASKGTGIYLLGEDSELDMAGDATVASGNNIYLDDAYGSRAYIQVRSALTPQETYAAEIVVRELTDSTTGAAGIKVIEVPSYIPGISISDVRGKFHIPDDNISGTARPCIINELGEIGY